MRVGHRFLVLGVTLAGTMSVLVTSCGNRQSEAPTPIASTAVGMEIDDIVITAKVKFALSADPGIRSFDLKVETRKGAVQLTGVVDHPAQIDRAIAIAGEVEGVRNVGNSIRLKIDNDGQRG